MGSSISKIADEIKAHGSWEAYCAWRDAIYFPAPEVANPEIQVALDPAGPKCQVVVFEKVVLK